ncbi:MAG: metal ABC transporter substrate-binding protein, partial [Desulfomonilaceae bacterium]
MVLKRLTILILTGLFVTWFGLAFAEEAKTKDKITVFVSIEPIAYFVKRVAGPLVNVDVLVGPGQEPHTFEPTPKLVTKLASAQALFKIGFPFEEELVKKAGSTFGNLKIVDLQQGIKLRKMSEAEEDHECDS